MTEKPIEYTRGKWEIVNYTGFQSDVIAVGEDGLHSQIIALRIPSNDAQLICAAINACISINKENPMAVAEGMGDIIWTLKMALEVLKGLPDYLETATNLQTIESIEQALSKIRGGK